jgi:acetyltransferase-like isoleucine patch superfamily enzyme
MMENKYQLGEGCVVKKSVIGNGTVIQKDCVIIQSQIGDHVDIEKRNLLRNAAVGDMTYTGTDTSIMWAQVGKFCCISRTVDIGGNEHNYLAAAMMPTYRTRNKLGGKLSTHHDETPVFVGNDVWIGQGVSIVRKPGLTVGDGAVIGAGAVVTKSIPPYAIAVGIPARVIRYRFSDAIIEALMALRWWDWPKEKILKNWDLLSGTLTEETVEQLKIIGSEEN